MKFCGVCILTDNASKLAAFYKTVLCEEPFIEGSHYEFEHAQLAVYDPGDVQVVADKNMSIMYFVEDVEAEYARLLSEIPDIGVTSPPVVRPWGAHSFWFLDPDGNTVSFIQKKGA